MNKLQELEKKYKELGEEIERLKNEGKVWKPKEDEKFYYFYGGGELSSALFDEDYENRHWTFGNCFKTEAEAEAMVEKIKIYTELKRLAEEIKTEPIDWKKSTQKKHRIFYDWDEEKILTDNNNDFQMMGTIYSTNKDFLKIAKERIGEDRLLKLFKED